MTDPIIEKKRVYLEKELKKLETLERDIEKIRGVVEEYGGVISWFLWEELMINIHGSSVKDATPMIRDLRKSVGIKPAGACQQPSINGYWLSYRHKASGIKIIIEVLLEGSKCRYVEDGRETKIKYKLVCD